MGEKPVTLNRLRKMAWSGVKIAALTCYDATTARWLAQAGVPLLLVGDTAGQMILGHAQTLHADLEFMIQITAAVKRGAPNCFVMADMPFMSYQADEGQAIRNAGRFLTQGCADAVKLEVDGSYADLVGRMARAGIPVVAHLGSRPQQVRMQGGYKAAGRTAAQANRIVQDSCLMAQRGAVMILLEATTAQTSRAVVARCGLPVIGCGAGPDCHGHVVVLHDLLGLSSWQPPFAKPAVQLGQSILKAAAGWIKTVQSGKYLRKNHPYRMDPGQEMGNGV